MVRYKFSDKLMFAIVMQDEEIWKTFIERLLPDKKVESVRFPQIGDVWKNLQLQLGDGSYTIVLDIKCSKNKVPRELEPFFTYVDTGKVDESDLLVKRIHDRVEWANEDVEVTQIMTLRFQSYFGNCRADNCGDGATVDLSGMYIDAPSKFTELSMTEGEALHEQREQGKCEGKNLAYKFNIK